MHRLVISACAGLASLLTPVFPAYAQTPFENREPGLWELRLVGGSQLANLALGVQGLLKNLPEEQRRQMQGLFGTATLDLGIPTITQQCLTPELAKRDIKPLLAEEGVTCSELEWQESGGTGRFSFVCSTKEGDFTGQGRIWDATARQFMSEATVQGKYKGQDVSLDMKHEARWLGADCKDVKPPQ